VSWERGDILKPSTYSPLLKDATTVIHSMGILLEADYKGVVSGRESPISGLMRAFSSTKQGSQNPMDRKPGDDLRPQEKDGQLTYELMNRDSAITLAKEAAEANAKSFCYISAAGGAPILPARYISTKREAESAISQNFPQMRSFFMRPGFMYDSSRPITMPLAAGVKVGSLFNDVTRGVMKDFLGAAAAKPMKADAVAEAVVEAIEDESVRGPVEVAQIEELANRAWRKGML
jgi:hypothetical protein